MHCCACLQISDDADLWLKWSCAPRQISDKAELWISGRPNVICKTLASLPRSHGRQHQLEHYSPPTGDNPHSEYWWSSTWNRAYLAQRLCDPHSNAPHRPANDQPQSKLSTRISNTNNKTIEKTNTNKWLLHWLNWLLEYAAVFNKDNLATKQTRTFWWQTLRWQLQIFPQSWCFPRVLPDEKEKRRNNPTGDMSISRPETVWSTQTKNVAVSNGLW